MCANNLPKLCGINIICICVMYSPSYHLSVLPLTLAFSLPSSCLPSHASASGSGGWRGQGQWSGLRQGRQAAFKRHRQMREQAGRLNTHLHCTAFSSVSHLISSLSLISSLCCLVFVCHHLFAYIFLLSPSLFSHMSSHHHHLIISHIFPFVPELWLTGSGGSFSSRLHPGSIQAHLQAPSRPHLPQASPLLSSPLLPTPASLLLLSPLSSILSYPSNSFLGLFLRIPFQDSRIRIPHLFPGS